MSGHIKGICRIHGKTWFTAHEGCVNCYEGFMPRQNPVPRMVSLRETYVPDFDGLTLDMTRPSIGRATYREMEMLLALEMSYVDPKSITKPEPNPIGQRPYECNVLVDEALGTRQMVTSMQLPADIDHEHLKIIGIEVIGPSKDDKLFIDVKLPEGWGKAYDKEDSRTVWVCDTKDNRRVFTWYKASGYDRSANGYVKARFGITHRYYNEYRIAVAWVVDKRIPGKERPIFQTKDHKSTNELGGFPEEERRAFIDECVAWLDANYPKWRERDAYWDIEDPPTVGEIPPFNQRTRQ